MGNELMSGLQLGIRFSVDAASNLPKITGPTFPVVSLVPPTTFYADPPLTEVSRGPIFLHVSATMTPAGISA